MKNLQKLAGLAIAALALPAIQAQAAVIVNDNFEYNTQADFETAWPVLSAPSGTLDTSRFVSPTKSVNYLAQSTNISRNGQSFAETGNPTAANPLTWSFQYYDELPTPTTNPHRQYSNLQDSTAPSANGQLIAMGLNNNLLATAEGGNYYMARILGINAGAFFKLNDPGAPLRTQGWHELKAILDGSGSVQFYVDGIAAKTMTGVTVRSYDNIRLGSGLSSTLGVNFDDMHLNNNAVPEPASLAGIGLAALFFARRHRRTK